MNPNEYGFVIQIGPTRQHSGQIEACKFGAHALLDEIVKGVHEEGFAGIEVTKSKTRRAAFARIEIHDCIVQIGLFESRSWNETPRAAIRIWSDPRRKSWLRRNKIDRGRKCAAVKEQLRNAVESVLRNQSNVQVLERWSEDSMEEMPEFH